MTYGVTDSGFNRKTFSDILDDLKERAENLFGENVDLGDTSPLIKIINVSALELARLWDAAESIYSAGYLNEASEQSLERIGILAGVSRTPASFSEGIVTFTGTQGTVVPLGTTISTSEGTLFETTEEGIIGETGEIDIEVDAVVAGDDGNVQADTITEFVDTVSGLTAVTNDSATSGGADRQTDASYRQSIRDALELEGKATETAITNALLNVSGVTSVSIVEEDDRSLTITIGGIGDKASLTEEKEDEIDDAIDDVRAFGIPVEWGTPTEIDIYVSGIVLYDDEPDDADSLVEDEIIDYITGLDVGSNVIYNKVIDVIFDTGSWVYDVSGLTIGDDPLSLGTSNITIADDEKAMADEDTVDINVT